MVDPTTSKGYPASAYDNVPASFLYGTPPPPWFLKIDPALVTASSLVDQPTINIDLLLAQADARIIGVQFKVHCPQILAVDSKLVSEGPLFKSFGETFFTAVTGVDAEGNPYVAVAVMLVPNAQGVWSSFVSGNGTLATIKFNVASLPATVTTFPLDLSDVIIIDDNGNILPYRRLENGAIMAPLKPEDLNGDGNVDILDIFQWALAFGTTETSPRWNPKADVNHDGKVNILDGVMIAKLFGFHA
jgi:hypothetical protein